MVSTLTLRQKWPADLKPATTIAGWHPDAARHAAQGALAMAVLPAVHELWRLPELGQAAVAIMAVMLVPVSRIGGSGLMPVSQRMLAFGGQLSNVTKLYDVTSTLPTYEPDPSTIRVLHVSDIHLNPASWKIIASLVEQYKVNVIVDTGDTMDHGTTAENGFLDPIAGTLIVVCVTKSIQTIPAKAAGNAEMMMKGSSQDWKLTTITK